MPKKQEFILSHKEMRHFKRRISQFLRHYRETNSLTQRQMAERVRMTPPRYCELENPHVEEGKEGKFLGVLDFLARLGSLEKVSPVSLIEFVFKDDRTFVPDAKGKVTHLTQWEKNLLRSFNRLDIMTRNHLIDLLSLETETLSRRVEGVDRLLSLAEGDWENIVKPLLSRLER
ncbi:MAG: helix-turn-helix domain-containing protein [Flavobacteriaceae bacterium]|nr:helix-turn-helix domain-containing protein [Flavobacteriaceae bacterium]